jgi:hypothetical protein
MTNAVTITKRLVNEGWTITGSLGAGGTIPTDIFLYLNTGTLVLGEFQSVVTISDMPKIPRWTGAVVPLPTSKWVRASTIKILVDTRHDVDEVISQLKASLQKFVKEFNSEKESTQTYVLD